MVAVLLPDLGLPIGLAKQPMKEVVGDAGETSAPSRAASGLISVHCALYSVQCKRTVYSVQCTVYSVQCTVYRGATTFLSPSMPGFKYFK